MTKPLSVKAFRDWLLARGEVSLEQREPDPNLQAGGREGFAICREIFTLREYQQTLAARYARERELRDEVFDEKTYWRYRYATLQIEYVHERLLIAYAAAGLAPHADMVSAQSLFDYNEFLATHVAQEPRTSFTAF